MIPAPPPSARRLVGLGVIAGALGGLLGVGGGFVLVPLQVMYAGTGQHRAQATSLLAIIPGSLVAVFVYALGAHQPEVDWKFAGLLVVGSVVGAYGGARLMRRLPERLLKQLFTVLLVGLAVKELLIP